MTNTASTSHTCAATGRTVIHFTDASVFGGAEQMILTLLAELDRARWTPILLHHGESGLQELIERSRRLDVPIVAIPRKQAVRSIRGYLRQSRPAIFHAHLNWPFSCSAGLAAAALARIRRVVATQQLFVPISSPRQVLRHKVLSTMVDRYIAVSHHMAKLLREVCVFADKRVRVVHNGVPLPQFEREVQGDLRERLDGGAGRPIVLTVARLDRQKGIEYLIEAACQVPEALFVVAGEGPERRALEDKAKACGVADRVVFLGYRRDIPELLASCDAFVLPSLYEGLPVSVLEAMASARPVVATDIGGTNEAVGEGVTGLLVPQADPAALARGIRRLLVDRCLAERLGTEGRERVQREFSSALVAARTMEIYDELVDRDPAEAAGMMPLEAWPG